MDAPGPKGAASDATAGAGTGPKRAFLDGLDAKLAAAGYPVRPPSPAPPEPAPAPARTFEAWAELSVRFAGASRAREARGQDGGVEGEAPPRGGADDGPRRRPAAADAQSAVRRDHRRRGRRLVPPLSARQYVALRAELALQPAPREETRRRYHVPNEAALRALDEHRRHPARRAELETALADFAVVLRGEVLR
jgi:hypothetical protein